MACGCQDKENDALIIEHYNKKKMSESENREQMVIHISWDGLLCDYSLYIPDESQILSIEKINGSWVAKCIDLS
jgi:hypothetical protein